MSEAPVSTVLIAAQRAKEQDNWPLFEEQLARGSLSGDIDELDHGDNTALHIAAQAGRTSAVRALVAAGASINIRDWSGWTPLALTCRAGHHECVAVLAAAGADVNMVCDSIGSTALTMAAEKRGCVRCIQILLDAGAHVNGPGDQWAPLHGAIWGSDTNKSKSEDCIIALLRAGADINAFDHIERSPLNLAMYIETNLLLENHPCRLVTTLLRKGARLQAPDELPTMNIDGMKNSKAMAYVDAVRQAGGIVNYEKMRRSPFITALTRCFPLPSDTILLVVEFWVRHALEY